MQPSASRPLVGITIGDPAGIGPEIVVKALTQEDIHQQMRPVVIGSRASIERALHHTSQNLDIHCMLHPAQAISQCGIIDLIDLNNVSQDLPMGRVQAAAGQAAFDYIKHAIDLALQKQLDAVATAPIHKEALRAAHIPYIGHTEIFADLTHSPDTLTMFEVRGIRILFLSRHVSLRQACDLVTRQNIIDTVHKAIHNLAHLGITLDTLAIAGLNPHAGDGGLHGREELDEITPAIEQLKAESIPVIGPIAADSIFYLAQQGTFHTIVSLYHDQGHIAAKCIDFERTVSVTLGLPFLRTSVDHGTAFDIAGTGKASAISMIESLRAVARLLGKGDLQKNLHSCDKEDK